MAYHPLHVPRESAADSRTQLGKVTVFCIIWQFATVMARKLLVALFTASIVVAVLLSTLCVLLLPLQSSERSYRYALKEGGRVVWLHRKTGREKIQLTSLALDMANEHLSTTEGECRQISVNIRELNRFPNGDTEVNINMRFPKWTDPIWLNPSYSFESQ